MQAGGSTIQPTRSAALSAIPCVIHQKAGPRSELSSELVENIEWIKQQNPGWEHIYYDDDDMLDFVAREYGPGMLSLMDRINAPPYGAVRADLFRYLLIFRCGGVYLDIKSRPLKPLGEIVRPDDCYLLAQWENEPGQEFPGFGVHPELRHIPGGEFQQWHIAAAPEHPFLAAVIARVVHNMRVYNPALHGTGPYGVLRLAGPVAYTLAIHPLLAQHPHRLVRSAVELGFCYSIYGGLAHWSRSPDHYSDAVDPILRVGPATRLAASLIQSARRVKASMLPAHRSPDI
jgi:hypothetical protein